MTEDTRSTVQPLGSLRAEPEPDRPLRHVADRARIMLADPPPQADPEEVEAFIDADPRLHRA